MDSRDFQRFGALAAILGGVAGLLYAISFIIARNALFSSLFLMLLGILATAALVAVYYRVRSTDQPFALWALLVGLAGAVGTAAHGGYDLANSINAPTPAPTSEILALPSQVDPRGLLTFGFAGIALFVFSWLILRSRALPRGLGYLGYLSAVLLAILYLGRLIVLDPANPIVLIPALVNGFIVSPLWYIWLGVALWQRSTVMSPAYQGPERRMGERREMGVKA